MNPAPQHPRLQTAMDVSAFLADAAVVGAQQTLRLLRRRRPAGVTRRPGPDSPMWNALAAELRAAVAPRNAKVRLARYLGIPKQRLHDFLRRRSRLPDAELTLRMLHWLAEYRASRDHSL